VADFVLYFNNIDKTHLPYVGGKGANLGELTKAGFPVPQGFCVTTWAYQTFIQTSREAIELFDLLDRLRPDELGRIRILGERIREHLAALATPDEIKSSILKAWKTTGEEKAYAVRSSATAEDLPTASFAGQQETYLNVQGQEQLLHAVQRCWASLFTDRAIAYRARNGFDHRSVFLSVVVQEMVFPEVSGIMFTADPVTGHRKTISIDASFGLGEALVSGLVSADLYQVRAGKIIKKQISNKGIAIYPVLEVCTRFAQAKSSKSRFRIKE
jgi:rifampicin phosphotransferase